MNRTQLFLLSAAVLALVAAVAAVPHARGPAPTPKPIDSPPPAAEVPIDLTTGKGSLTLVARLSHPFVGLGEQDVFATVDVTGAPAAGDGRSPVNVALVIDRSSSMSGFKLSQAKLAAQQLIDQLGPSDRLALVHYGSDVKSLQGLWATDANKVRLRAYVDSIWDDGGTNIGAGLAAGSEALRAASDSFKVNRLILISDGQPTLGLTTHDALVEIVRGVRAQGVSVSSIGVGADFNEELMEAFAEVGAGAYGYLSDASQLATIFQKDLNSAGTQVARDVALSFRVPARARLVQVLGHSQVSRHGAGADEQITVQLPDFAAGQRERVVVALKVTGSSPGQSVDVSAVELTYSDILQDTVVRAQTHLSSMTAQQQVDVTANRDKEATVYAARALAAVNSQRAAALLGSGDRTGAKSLIEANRALFDEAGTVSGLGAIEEDVKAQQAAVQQFNSEVPMSEPQMRVMKKQLRNKARVDFGLMGSTY